jgi:hypothetical protein
MITEITIQKLDKNPFRIVEVETVVETVEVTFVEFRTHNNGESLPRLSKNPGNIRYTNKNDTAMAFLTSPVLNLRVPDSMSDPIRILKKTLIPNIPSPNKFFISKIIIIPKENPISITKAPYFSLESEVILILLLSTFLGILTPLYWFRTILI